MNPRSIPSIDSLLRQLRDVPATRELLVAEIQTASNRARRNEIPPGEILTEVRASIAQLRKPSLRQVINATGIILHSGLGYASLDALPVLDGYVNFEYDLRTGKRFARDNHFAAALERLIGARAVAVNNHAAAIYLALDALARGHEVVVSQTDLADTVDDLAISEILAHSGAVVRTVGGPGTPDIEEYRAAISQRTHMILRFHPGSLSRNASTESLRELSLLARSHGVPLYVDVSHGNLTDLSSLGLNVPTVQECLETGASLVSFPGNLLLGGPQSGILAGEAKLLERIRRNRMYCAFRCSKTVTAALESTLRKLLFAQYDQIPAQWMIRRSSNEIKARAIDLAEGLDAEVTSGESTLVENAQPPMTIPTWLISFRDNPRHMDERLRLNNPPVVTRLEEDRLLVDLRTVFPEEEMALRSALQAAAES